MHLLFFSSKLSFVISTFDIKKLNPCQWLGFNGNHLRIHLKSDFKIKLVTQKMTNRRNFRHVDKLSPLTLFCIITDNNHFLGDE